MKLDNKSNINQKILILTVWIGAINIAGAYYLYLVYLQKIKEASRQPSYSQEQIADVMKGNAQLVCRNAKTGELEYPIPSSLEVVYRKANDPQCAIVQKTLTL